MEGWIPNEQDCVLAELGKENEELYLQLQAEETTEGKKYIRCGYKAEGSVKNPLIKFINDKGKGVANCDYIES